MPQQVRQGLILIAVAAAVYLPRLGATRLWDDDETFFAQVAREMYDRGDVVVPWFNQALFSHKPPFMYWMMMGAYRLFGVTEFAARLPAALFGIANVLLVWRLGRLLYSPGVGFWGGIILATSLNFVVISRSATCDAELIFFCTLALYLFVRGSASRRAPAGGTANDLVWDNAHASLEPTWTTWALVYAAMGAAVMVKGPIGVLLPTSVLGLYLLWRRGTAALRSDAALSDSSPINDRMVGTAHPTDDVAKVNVERRTSNVQRRINSTLDVRRSMFDACHRLAYIFGPRNVAQTIWKMRPLTALAVVLLVAGPWFTAVAIMTNCEFLVGFFGEHHFHRFTAPMDNHAGPVWFYLAAICAGFFPWIIFLSPSIAEMRRRALEGDPSSPADVLVMSWVVVWVGFFTLATTKFPHYVVPAYPALALFTASFVDRWTRETEIYGRALRSAAWLTMAAAGLGILVVVPLVARRFLPGEPLLGLAGLPLIVGAIACALFAERRQIVRTLASLTVASAIFLLLVFGIAAVQVDRHQNTQALGEAIRRHSSADGLRIATYGYFRPGLVYYCNHRIEPLPDLNQAAEFLRTNSDGAFLVTTEEAYRELESHLPAQFGVLKRGPWFLKSGQTVVLLGKVSADALVDRGGGTDGRRE
jgi:4-amino-4-deoxy-L-arabinose transferase-like glycosyltransferase